MAQLTSYSSSFPPNRLARIGQARQALLYNASQPGALAGGAHGVDSWIERSWQRCLANGHRPEHAPSFEIVAAPAQRRTQEANRLLVQAARPVLEKLGQAIANTRYFAILTNQHGVVIDANGAIDRSDPRADLITRIGTDLSEHQLATTAISAALTELQPVWLHRGEHFFDANTVYSCAGAPLFGPDGHCVGMLDLTGIETPERPELKHLVSQSARSIENALTLTRLRDKQGLLLRLNWPGRALGDESDGLICADGDGFVLGANQTARQMLPQLNPASAPGDQPRPSNLHCSELFATAFETLFDTARHGKAGKNNSHGLEVPLWSGLRLQALPQMAGQHTASQAFQSARPEQVSAPLALKDLETALIRKAVNEAKGNVMKAARALGISRATVYRRLGKGKN